MKLHWAGLLVLSGIVPGLLRADTLAIVAADSSTMIGAVESGLALTGQFSAIDVIDPSAVSAPQLEQYTDVLAWTAETPSANLSSALLQYYDSGGKHLTIAGFTFRDLSDTAVQQDPLLSGAITMQPYAAFGTSGTLGLSAGSFVETALTDPIFQGIDPATVGYFVSPFLANPSLAPGATLLATDAAGVPLIARSQNGIVDMNLYLPLDSSQSLFQIVANSFPAGGGANGDVPEPSSLAVLAAMGLVITSVRRFRGTHG